MFDKTLDPKSIEQKHYKAWQESGAFAARPDSNAQPFTIMMPPPNGVEVLNHLKADPATRMIPVFIVSVVANRLEVRGELSKAQAIFPKPLDTQHFIAQMKKVCGALN